MYVIRKSRDSLGLFEFNGGVWTQRGFAQRGKRAVALLLKIAATLGLLIALLLPGSAIAQPQAEALWRFEVTTAWIGDGAEDNANRPLVADDYPHVFNPDGTVAQEGIRKWEDKVGQPSANLHPSPNLYNVQAEATESVLDDIESDNDYLVVWSSEVIEEDFAPQPQAFSLAAGNQGKDKDGVPPPAEFGQLRSFLARNGVSQAEITAVIGVGAQGRSRSEITGILRDWMREFPKSQ